MTDADEPQPSLREAHTQATRDRILDAFADLLTETHPASISVPEVARRASVGVATVYRHFPKKIDLFDSYAGRNQADALPLGEYDDPTDRLRAIASNFAKREPYYRVERFGPVIDEIRSRRSEMAFEQWYSAIDESFPNLDREPRERLCRTLAGLFTPWTYISMRDEGGMSPDEAIEALVLTVQAVFRSAARDQESQP